MLRHKPRPLPNRLKPYNRPLEHRILQALVDNETIQQQPVRPRYDNHKYWHGKGYKEYRG